MPLFANAAFADFSQEILCIIISTSYNSNSSNATSNTSNRGNNTSNNSNRSNTSSNNSNSSNHNSNNTRYIAYYAMLYCIILWLSVV